MDPAEPLIRAQRVLIAAAVVINGALFWRGLVDIFSIPRATVAVAVLLVLVALSAARVVRTGRVSFARTPLVPLAALFVIALGVAVAAGEDPMQAVMGPYTRYTGFAMYATYAALAVFMVHVYDRRSVRQLTWAMFGALAIVTGYGLVQLAGLDPLDWPQPEPRAFNTDFSTLGNVDFSAAFVGITAPAALWGLLAAGHRVVVRIICGIAFVGAAVYAVGTGAFQGPVTLVAGSALVAGTWLVDHRRLAVAAAVALGVAVVISSPFLVPRVVDEFGEAEERVQFWDTAVEMWLDSPIAGGGLGVFGEEFPARRPIEHAGERLHQSADAPHNVPLELLVGGGILLGGAYLTLVLFTGRTLVRGLRRLTGDDRLLLAAFGGSWLAYQLQSLVSIDVPPLAIFHWLLTGAIVVLATSARRSTYRVSGTGRAVVAVPAYVCLVLLLAVATWGVSRPLRADVVAADARDARSQGDLEVSAERAERATEMAPWEASYWAFRAGALDRLGKLDEATRAGERAAREAPGNSAYALAVAGLAERRQAPDEARAWVAEAIARDPHNPQVLRTAARFLIANGSPAEAVEILDESIAIVPRNAEGWALLGTAYDALGEDRLARSAYERALELDPDNRAARQYLGHD